jgi:hypothetical protein
MMRSSRSQKRGRWGIAVLLAGVLSGSVGCGVLEVSDPTAIVDSELNDAAGAQLLRGAALKAFTQAVGIGTPLSGLLADEFFSDPSPTSVTVSTDMLLDSRQSEEFEAQRSTVGYQSWQESRRAASVALAKVRRYALSPATVAEILALRAFATLRVAADFCPGFPLHDVVDYAVIYGPPLSTEAALSKALGDLDSAATLTADSARVTNIVRVLRARTLIELGRLPEAASAAEQVPTAFVWNGEFSSSVGVSNLMVFTRTATNSRRSVANREGGTGLDFVSASDPRLGTDSLGPAYDGRTGIYSMRKYPNANAPIVLASGIEARLIEAEAALRQGNAQWLTTLNTLRTDGTRDASGSFNAGTGGVAGLAPLTDLSTDEARLDLIFRERAFWLFGTGLRLADLRRLVRLYGRSAESVFPSGEYRLGGSYGSATSIAFIAATESPFSRAVTGCTNR